MWGFFRGGPSQQAGGSKAGVQVQFTQDDIDLIRNTAPFIRHISRTAEKDATLQEGAHLSVFPLKGVDPGILNIWALTVQSGRFLNDEDLVSTIMWWCSAPAAKDKLFSGMPALGESVRIDGVSFQVMGVLEPRMEEEGDDNDNKKLVSFHSLPWATSRTLTTWTASGWIWRDWIMPSRGRHRERDGGGTQLQTRRRARRLLLQRERSWSSSASWRRG